MAKKIKKIKVLSFTELCGAVVPVFTTQPQCASITELKDNHAQENTYVHSRSAVIKFKDSVQDKHSVSFAPVGNGYVGSFSLGAVNQKSDSFSWTFKLPDGAIDHLQAGETLVQVYNVSIRDGANNVITTQVTIKIVGTNDAPVITSAVQAATVCEVADGAQGENATTHVKTGAVTFADVDTLDTHTAKVVPLGNNYIGTLAIGSVDQGTDSIGWTFSVPDSVLDPLGPKDVRVQQYRVTVDDGHGGTASQVITITIRGADDGVTISDLKPAAQGGDLLVDEDDLPAGTDTSKEQLTGTGNFKISTPDGLDDLTVGGKAVITNGVFTAATITTPLGNTLKITSFDAATGVVTYTYTLNGAEKHDAGAGENTLFEKFAVVLTDKDGSSATASLDVGVVDDVPQIRVTGPGSSLIVDETDLGTNASANFASSFTGQYGADGSNGAGTSYALSLSAAGADSGLTDSVSGQPILLYMDGGSVVGLVGGSNGAVAFRLSVDSAGNVTLDQIRAIAHEPNTGPDETASIAPNVVALTATITDSDGDSATASLDIGTSSIFCDDAPAISASAAAAGVLVVDETTLSIDDSASFASLFTTTFGNDQAGAITYALAVSATGVDSGLDDSATGDSILLFVENGSVVGRVGSVAGDVSFRLTVDAAGTVTLNQQRAILHTPDAGPDQAVSLAPGLISIVATVTDSDGDAASASVNIGHSLSFRDDAPTAGKNALVQLDDDTIAHGNSGGVGDDVNSANTTGVLAHDFGTDGGSIALLTSGAPSGFTYVSSGSDLLVRQGTVTVLSVTLDPATGAYTVTQHAAIQHAPGNDENNQGFTITYRVTDNDGDSVDGTLSIDVDDDTPTVTITGPSSVNENGAAIDGTYQFAAGADWISAGQLVIDVDGAGQQTITSGQLADGETIVTSAGTLTVSAPDAGGNGTWTFTPSSVGATASVNIRATVVDGDGDSAVQTHTIQVVNVNQPLVISGAVTGLVEEEHGLPGGIEDETSGPPDLDADAGGNLALTTNVHQGSFGPLVQSGVDGALSFAIAALSGNPAVQTIANGALTSGGRQVYFANDGGNLVGYTNGDGGNGSFGAGDTKVFELALTNAATGAYTFTLLAPVDHPSGASENAIAINLNGRVSVTDSGGPVGDTNVPLNASITVIDDVPVAANDKATVVEGDGQNFNCAFVLDFSGSINNGELNQMLTAVKAAGEALFNGTSGDVSIRLVAFSSSSASYGPLTSLAAFNAQIDALNPAAGGWRPFDGGTDFTDGIQTTMAVYTPLAGWSNQVFFLSDGNPNEQTGAGGSSLNSATATAWNAFVNGVNPVNVTTIGIGDGIITERLQDVDVDGSGSPISVGSFSDLISTLIGVVGGGDVSGNVLGNDGFGADGAGRITSIEINGATYSYNGAQITSSAGGAPIAGSLLSNVTTEIGGKLTFNFATGAWHFTAPKGLVSDVTGAFAYTIVDRDGDASTASLAITVQHANDAPINTVPSSIAVAEDTPTKLTGISFTDADIGASNLTVTLSIPTGSGSLAAASTAGVTVGGTSSALTLTGTLAAINTFLATSAQGVTFTPLANATADVTLTVTSNDGGGSGAGGALSDTDTVVLDLTSVNDAPVATITASSYAATEQVNLALHGTGLSVFDVDAGNDNILVRLSVTAGVLTVSAGNSGASVSGSGTSTVTITGSQTEINNLLGGIDTGFGAGGTINYIIDSNTPPANATLTLFVDDTGDNGAGGSLTHSTSVTIGITAVNDAPVATNDIVITNVTPGTAFDIPKWALLLNDSDPEGSSIDITAINSTSGLSNVSLTASKVTLTDSGNEGGSFVYNLSDGAANRTATVTVTYDSNTMTGGNDAEIFIGNSSGTNINAGGGNDILIGNGGNDALTGGSGNDIFVFSAPLNGATNVDTIHDFDANPSGGQDLIYLDRSIFTTLSAGALSAAAFVANTSGNASNANQRIIFETDTGALYYDADGNGAGAKVQFATLNGFSGGAASAIDHTDFFVI
ncbi:DUF5801 repeats-in-toxin domain-containing protein [Hyphomicrobium sp. LHD-15]|uniref:DUF5801 repeats-in-toxin domain-containing protein n=1 Tax=Hyphomicrobium sp. LHD-15 TaxID=3072142 RepID=UPI00280F8A8D|nr:DUF5801 repeats-in-toxin domain-containing protein [Hyphomicrobium sp. LHD-15]MDQ8697724.1 DUF5801 repeats-in-toxin domain-containing protein [Hyphomicrobium sp. LHD-15]